MQCATCALMTGWGGSGAFSDGKLTLTTQVGGLLADIRGSDEAEQLVREVDDQWVHYGADSDPYVGDMDRIERLSRKGALAGLRLQHYPIRHLGTERSGAILGAMHRELVARGAVFERQLAHNPTFDITHAFLRDPDGHLVEIQRFATPLT